jgi:hypothetical protein
MLGGVIRTGSGDQFQVRWGVVKDFARLYRIIQQAIAWENSHVSEQSEDSLPKAVSGAAAPPDLPGQLGHLGELFEKGLLTEVEFVQAKKRLLNP